MSNRSPVAPLCLLTFLVACSGSDDDLSQRIASTVAVGDGSVVDFRELASFAWDRLHILAPYTSDEAAAADLGFSWAGAGGTGIAERDDVAVLVFVRDGEVVRYVAHPRDQGDFAELKRPGGWRPAAALFVARAREGSEWIVLVEPGEKSNRNQPGRAESP